MKNVKKLLAVLLAVCLFSAPTLAQAQEQAAAAEENIGGALGSDFVQPQPQIADAGKNSEGMIASALPQTQTGNVAGEWKLTKALAQGLTLAPEDAGITNYSIIFNSDGTCSSKMALIDGTISEDYGTWSQSGVMVTVTSQTTGEVATLSLQSDGTLRIMEDRTIMFFTRISAAPQTPDTSGGGLPPSTNGDTSAAGSFEGKWVLQSASANGQTVTPADMGVQMIVTLNAGGTGTIYDGTDTGTCTWTQNGTTANVIEPDGTTTVFTMQSDGTVSANVDGVILNLVREGNAAAPVNYPAAGNGQSATGNGFTMQVPQGWMIINDATVQQLVQTYGQQAVDSSGINNQLQYVKSMGILLYYSADFNSSVYVTQENAQGVTMDTLLSMEQTFASNYANAGMAGFDMAGPVDFSGKTYYTGTFGASNPMKLYYQIVNGVLYTVTLTGVSDADAALILGSFTVNG